MTVDVRDDPMNHRWLESICEMAIEGTCPRLHYESPFGPKDQEFFHLVCSTSTCAYEACQEYLH